MAFCGLGNAELESKQGRPPRNSEKGAVRCCRRAMRGDNPAPQRMAYFCTLVPMK